MTRFFKTLSLLALLAPVPALADQVVLDAPLAGASLHEGGVDMALYYVDGANDAFEVVATYAPTADAANVARVRMSLGDGDATQFALPGHRDTMFTFERRGTAVHVSAEPTTPLVAVGPDA